MHYLRGIDSFEDRVNYEVYMGMHIKNRPPESITFAYDPKVGRQDDDEIRAIIDEALSASDVLGQTVQNIEARNPIDPCKISRGELEAIFAAIDKFIALPNCWVSTRQGGGLYGQTPDFRVKAGDVVRPIILSELPNEIGWLKQFVSDNIHVVRDGMLLGEFLFLLKRWFHLENSREINFSGACNEDALGYKVDPEDPVKSVLSVMNRPSIEIFDPFDPLMRHRIGLINALWRTPAELGVVFDSFGSGQDKKWLPNIGEKGYGALLLWQASTRNDDPQVTTMPPQVMPCTVQTAGSDLIVTPFANTDGSARRTATIYCISAVGKVEMPIDDIRLSARGPMHGISAQLVGIRGKVCL